jgi:uncharacterized delta-60 repeat protein
MGAAAATAMLVMATAATAQTVDAGFRGQIDAVGQVQVIKPLAHGKILIGGLFTQVNGQARASLARLLPDGSLDPTFVGGADSAVEVIVEQADGRFLIGGAFTEINGQPRSWLARLDADGVLDTTFTPTLDGAISAIVIQPDGQFVVAGSFVTVNGQPRVHVARFHADDTLDADFHPAFGTSFNAVESLALQRDGLLLAAGSFENVNGQPRPYLARLRTDGSVDPSFHPTFDTNGYVRAVLVQPDGHLMLGGWFTEINGQSRPYFARLAPDGTLDAAPATPGSVVLTLTAQPDGRVLMGGYFTDFDGTSQSYLARVFADGSFDASFAPTIDAAALVLVVQDDGQVLLGGFFNHVNGQVRHHLARVHANGVSNAGVVADTSGAVTMLATQPDGAALVGGTFLQLAGQTVHSLARLRADGSLDSGFADSNGVQMYGAAVARDGTPLVLGDFTTLGGQSRDGVGHLLADGSIDLVFTPPTFANAIYTVAALDDGRAVIGGSFSSSGVVPPRDRLGIVQVDGTFDPGFTPTVLGQVEALVVQPDNHILLGGQFIQIGGKPRRNLARVSPTGAVDLDFVAPLLNAGVQAMVRQPDGKLLVIGPFTQVGAVAQAYMMRLLADGSGLDPDFHVMVDAGVSAIALQADGRIIIGGDFTQVNSVPRSHLARLLTDGSLDPDFTAGIDAFGTVNALAFAPDGTLWVGGFFTTIAGEAHTNLARVRLADLPEAQRFDLGVDRTAVTWQRGGPIAELARVSIEQSLDGTTWTDLGIATPQAGGWSLGGLTVPRNQNVWLRASGVSYYGRYNAGSRVSTVRLVYLAAHDVTPSAGPHGTLSQTVPQHVDEGETITLTATPDAGYHLVTVGGCGGALVGSTYTTAPVFAACTVTATFAIDTYAVTSTAGLHGTIAPAGVQVVDFGETRAFTIAPATGYHVGTVTGCGGTLTVLTFTTAPIVAACTVTASFAADPPPPPPPDPTPPDPTPPTPPTPPAPTSYMRYFAEGAANGFFTTRLAVLNPNAAAATVLLRLDGANGQQTSLTRVVPARTRTTIDLNADVNLPDAVFSSSLESDRPIVADRLMTWDATGYGSSLQTGASAIGTTWYFAEGATGGAFSLYYLLQNPNATAATATVTYLLPAPHAPVVKTYTVSAHSRFTIDVTGEDPALRATDVAAKITSDQPIFVERAMYLSTPGQLLAAGDAGAGIPAPAMRWFVAEGSTGFFDEYVLIANGEADPANLTITYLIEGADPLIDHVTVEARSRRTIDLKAYAALASVAVSVIAESTNAVPVVVERVMWWPQGHWYESSVSAGVTSTGTTWAFAEGEQGGPSNSQTYIAIANTDPINAGTATVTLLFEDGTTAVQTVPLPAARRTTVDAGAFPEAHNRRFAAIVESNGVPIVVERALYQSADAVFWSAGAASVATRLTP